MGKPWYQKAIESYIPWTLVGIMLVGSILDVMSNVVNWVTPAVTYVGTASVSLIFALVAFFLRRRPLSWVAGSMRTRIRALGPRPLFVAVGVLVALWLPRFVSAPNSELRSDLDPPTKAGSHKTVLDAFPMYVGSSWSYTIGRLAEGQEPEPTSITGRYTDTIIFRESGPSDIARIIMVSRSGNHLPSEWSTEDGKESERNLWYVVDEHRLYTARSRQEAWEISRALYERSEDSLSHAPDYVVPFRVGAVWVAFGDMTPMKDMTAYQWYVQDKVNVDVPAGRFEDCFRIVLWTSPDKTIRWVCPGVGLVAEEYHHHGAVNDYSVELSAFSLTGP